MAVEPAALTSADHTVSPPKIHIPRDYNAAVDLVERNLVAGRAEHIAFITSKKQCEFALCFSNTRRLRVDL